MSDILINDIFNSDAFAVSTLAAAVNELPYVPGQAGRLGIFEEMGVSTTTVALERNQGVVKLVANSPRGSATKLIDPKRREMRNFTIPHFSTRASIQADSLRNVRAFGSNQLRGLEEVRNFYMMNHMASLDATVEYGRIGAIKGNILDSDGSTVIYNLFTEFGLTQDSTDFALNTTTTDVLGKCTAVLRNMDNALGGSGYTNIVAFCGDTFYDSLRSHANVKQFYTNWMAAAGFTQDFRYRGFPFGEILFINYRGSIGGVGFVPTKEAYAVPVGVPGLFKTVFGPADYLEAIGQLGLPRYAKAELTELGKGIEIELQTNALSFCVRPQVLQKMTTP
jgi:hypothetical protein